MRILILSDIHANLLALEAVLDHAGEVDAVWCLGDIVGYGPSPNDCVARVRELTNLICLLGNHDAAAIGNLPLNSFNYEARSSIEWLNKKLSTEASEFLMNLPLRSQWENFTLVHASPREPLLEYILDTRAAAENFNYFEGDYCFVGHTHIPMLFTQNSKSQEVSLSTPTVKQSSPLKARSIINPGSVGQPRDRDPRAAYMTLDSKSATWEFHRVEYDIPSVQKQMRAVELPERNVLRLESGW